MNDNLLTIEEGVSFNRIKDFGVKQSFSTPLLIMGLCTTTAFLGGLWRLPSRVSTVKYTLGGLTIGMVSSYAVWKYSMIGFYQQLNELLRKVLSESLQTSPTSTA
jgi:hypothetical protein